MENLRISLVQTALHWENKAANLDHFAGLLNKLQDKTDLLVLPEMFTTGFSMQAEQLAEPLEGATLQWMRQQAERLDAVITGSYIVEDQGQYYNRLLWVHPDGAYQYYDKRHLFALGREHQHYTAGTTRVITSVKGWKVLPLICYDLRFPVWSRNTEGYDLLVYVANWPELRNQAWKTLLAGRAIENQVYTVGVNRVGADGNGVPHSGDSSVLDFAGTSLFQASSVEGVFSLTLSAEAQRKFREQLPFLKDQDIFTVED